MRRAWPLLWIAFLTTSAIAGDLSWLAGTWSGGNARETWECRFTGDEGGVVLGTYKQADRSGKLTFVELQQLDLRARPAVLTLVANAGAPYALSEVRLTPDRAEFAGAHAFPRTAAFVHTPDGGLALELAGVLGGKPFHESFPMHRAK